MNNDKYTEENVLFGLANYEDKEKVHKILAKCHSPKHIAEALNILDITLNKILTKSECLLADDLICGMLCCKAMEYISKK